MNNLVKKHSFMVLCLFVSSIFNVQNSNSSEVFFEPISTETTVEEPISTETTVEEPILNPTVDQPIDVAGVGKTVVDDLSTEHVDDLSTEHEEEEPEIEGDSHENESIEIDLEESDEQEDSTDSAVSFEQKIISIIDGDSGRFYSFMNNVKNNKALDLGEMNIALSEYQTKVKNVYLSSAESTSQVDIQEILEAIQSAEITYKIMLKFLVNDNFTWLLHHNLIANNSLYSQIVQKLQSMYTNISGISSLTSIDLVAEASTSFQDQAKKIVYSPEQMNDLYSLFDLGNEIAQKATALQAYSILLCTNAIVSGIVIMNL